MRIIRYFYVGAIAAAVDIGLFAALVHGARMDYLSAGALTFVLATAVNYALSIRHVFQSGARFRRRHEVALVFLVSAIGLAVNQLVLFAGVTGLGLYPVVAKVIATGVVFFWNYGARARYVFKPESGEAPLPSPEALFEPLLRQMRLRKVLPTVARHKDCRLLDIGCGWKARLLYEVEPYVREGVGIDFKAPAIDHPKLRTLAMTLETRLPFADQSFDVVTLLAVLEHLAYPRAMLEEISRVLRPGGEVVVTVPSKAARPVLEFLAYRLRLVSEAEIRDHKAYYDRRSLQEIFEGTGLRIDRHAYFQLGMNNFLCATKT